MVKKEKQYSTHYQGSPDEELMLDTFIKFKRAHIALENATRQVLIPFQLSECQFGVLEALYFLGPLSPKMLSHKLLRTEGNLTLVLKNLLESGLVDKKPSKKDNRSYTVKLTASGNAKIREVFPAFLNTLKKHFDILSPEEQKFFGQLSRKLGKQENGSDENLS